jgi:hypothetical protein
MQALGRALHSIQDFVAHGGGSIYEDKHNLHGINEWLKRSKNDQLLTKILTQRYLQEFLDATKTGKTKEGK